MKIICCGDIHNREDKLKLILNKCPDYDYAVLNGDITNFGTLIDYNKIMKLMARNKTFINWGNCDSPEVIDTIIKNGRCLNAKGIKLPDAGLGIFGLSGSNITPFNTYGEYTEEDLYKSLFKGYFDINDCKTRVLFSHVPPYGTHADRTSRGIHAGSKALRNFLSEYCIEFNFCGHIHESCGYEKFNNTRIYNIGAVKNGRYAVITTDSTGLDVKLMHI